MNFFDLTGEVAVVMGATGVLLKVDPSDCDYGVTAGDKGTFYQVPMKRDPKSAVAEAIFVVSE